jgi:hypothetical protein
MIDPSSFTARRVAIAGHEIRNPDGRVIAWTATESWAAMIAFVLNQVEAEGLTKCMSHDDDERGELLNVEGLEERRTME